MTNLFTDKPDFTPYNVLKSNIPLDEVNPQPTASKSTTQTAWGQASAQATKTQQDIDRHENILNRAFWYRTKGFDKPYPGEKKFFYQMRSKNQVMNLIQPINKMIKTG